MRAQRADEAPIPPREKRRRGRPALRRRLPHPHGFVAAAAALVSVPSPSQGGLWARPPLSSDPSRPSIRSSFGSGSFGHWAVDNFKLPAYRYTIDEETAPQAKQPELNGKTDAWHQVGNDHV